LSQNESKEFQTDINLRRHYMVEIIKQIIKICLESKLPSPILDFMKNFLADLALYNKNDNGNLP
jgi:hypothetical protein